jgi:hypothetical protein
LAITSQRYGRHEFVIDRDDIPRLARYTWFINYCPRTQYFSAQYKQRHNEKVGLTELVLGISITTHHQVLHRNGNRYDCRKRNLIVLPSRQKRHVAKNRAAFIGVTPHHKKYHARIFLGGHNRHLPSVTYPEYAAYCYDVLCQCEGIPGPNQITLNPREKAELFHELAKAATRKLKPATYELLDKVLTSLEKEVWAVSGDRGTPCAPLMVQQ